MVPNKEITIYDIAEYLHISATTVSRGLKDNPAISKLTRRKIADAAHRLGYRSNSFASSLRSKTTQTLGVIVPRISSYFMAAALAGMEDAASRQGYTLIINHSNESMEKEEQNARTMFNKRVDGLLISVAYDTSNTNHLQPFFDRNIPIVFFDRTFPHKESMSIEIDNFQAGYEVTKHLLDQGFRKIAHLTGNLLRNVYADRLEGYKKALQEYRIPFDKQRLYIGPLSHEAGIQLAEKMIAMKNRERPDAVFAANDTSAVYCMLRLKEAGFRIPADIGFAGFNNDPVSEVVSPKLTTIHYPGYQVGEAAVNQMISHLKGHSVLTATPRIILRSELLIRNSSQKKKTS